MRDIDITFSGIGGGVSYINFHQVFSGLAMLCDNVLSDRFYFAFVGIHVLFKKWIHANSLLLRNISLVGGQSGNEYITSVKHQ